MTKKSLNKLLSVILALAICFTTVYGCLISASAATGCYSWSDGKVAEDLKSATIKLTITAPDTMKLGVYEAFLDVTSEATVDDTLVLNSVEITGGKLKASGEDISADQYQVSVENQSGIEIYADPTDEDAVIEDYLFSSIELELGFSFASGSAVMGQKYYALLTRLDLADSFGNEYTEENFTAKGLMNAGCDHVFDVTGLTPIENKIDGYYVYTDVPCVRCKDYINPYQVVPATELKNVIYWDGTVSAAEDLTGSGTEADPYIIDSAADLAYVTSNTVTGNYKIADGIDAIVLQSSDHAAILDLADFEQTKAYFDAAIKAQTVTVWKNGGTFQGTFDGNGVEIYGMYCKDGWSGLFSTVNVSEDGSTIKNIAVKNSYVLGTDASSALVSRAVAAYSADYGVTELTAIGRINFDKVVIANCYIFNKYLNNTGARLGVMLASAATYVNVSMDNCLVYGNDIKGYYKYLADGKTIDTGDTVDGGLFGILSTGHNGEKTKSEEDGTYTYRNGEYKNSIILDCVPYYADQDKINAYCMTTGGNATSGRANHAFRPDFFSNIYTNCTSEYTPTSIAGWYTWSSYADKIITIDKNDVKGVNAQAIVDKFGGDWRVDELGGYPKFDGETVSVGGTISYYNGDRTKENGDTMVLNDPDANGNTQAGTQDDPIIIDNADELAYVCSNNAKIDNTNVYYKVADGIAAFVLQTKNNFTNSGITLEDLKKMSGTEVKNALTSYSSWFSDAAFNGHFDGNGATIYGMRAGAGLFAQVGPDAVIKNISVKNSYVSSGWYGGGIVGRATSVTLGGNTYSSGTVKIENCSVGDCYIEIIVSLSAGKTSLDDGHFGGTIIGYANGDIGISVRNCISYNSTHYKESWYTSNDTAYSESWTRNTIIGNMKNISNTDTDNVAVYNEVENVVCIGCVPWSLSPQGNNNAAKIYQNIYTDTITPGNYWMTLPDESKRWDISTYTGIHQISTSEVEGAAAADTLQGFDFENVWSYDANGGYPTPVADKIPATSQFNLNLLGTNIDYNNDGTFNFNFYYEDAYGIGAPTLYVGRADATGFNKLSGSKLKDGVAANDKIFANAGIDLAKTNVYKYTITNISARELGETLLPTAVATNGVSTVYGKTEAISLNKYASAILTDSNADATDKNVVAALVNYGAAAKDVLNSSNNSDAEATKTIYWDGKKNETFATLADADDGSGNGSSWDKAIIIDNANELYYLARKSTAAETTGKYFKIADGIKNIILQKEDVVNTEYLMGLTSAADVKTYLDGLSGKIAWDNGGYCFNGNFDGNGATVYGMYATGTAGLFGLVDGGTPNDNDYYTFNSKTYYYDYTGITIKNINVKNSYYFSTWRLGGIIAGSNNLSYGNDVAGAINIEGCAVINCYMTNESTTIADNQNRGSKGVIAGQVDFDLTRVNNCLTYGNVTKFYHTPDKEDGYVFTEADITKWSYEIALVGGSSDMWLPKSDTDHANGSRVPHTVTNSIILDARPYGFNFSYAATYNDAFKNVYTNFPAGTVTFENMYNGEYWTCTYKENEIKHVEKTDVIGAAAATACPNLGWDSKWLIDIEGGYPSLIQRPINNNSVGKTLYWSGGNSGENSEAAINDTNAGGTSWEDAIIIDNPEELYHLTNYLSYSENTGKYYKVADGIDRFVMQPDGVLDIEELLSCADGDAVYKYLNDVVGTANLKNWNTNAEKWFNGHFDGNGVEIIGMYSQGNSAGLFPTADGGKPNEYSEDNTGNTFKNFTVAYSYVLANGGQYRAGAIIGGAPGVGYGNKVNGTFNFENCVVANCYVKSMKNGEGSCGLILGVAGSEVAHIKNCIVYGNTALYTDSTTGELKNAPLYHGINDRLDRDEEGNKIANTFIYNTVENSIILGVRPYGSWWSERVSNDYCLEYVYTDQSITPYSGKTYGATDLIAVTADGLIGSKAQSVVSELNKVSGTTWYIGNEFDGMPSFKPSGVMPTLIQEAYNNFKLTKYDDYGESDLDFGVYRTNINLKNNPYIGITFALGRDYKAVREDIDITISTIDAEGNVLEEIKKVDDDRMPAFEEGQYISNVNGWTNKQNAGRFHLYTLKDLHVTDMCESIKITMSYNGDAAEKRTVTAVVGVEGFGLDRQNQCLSTGNDYYAKCAEAAKALVYYSQALKVRFG